MDADLYEELRRVGGRIILALTPETRLRLTEYLREARAKRRMMELVANMERLGVDQVTGNQVEGVGTSKEKVRSWL
ncbi:hypothetical protein CALCODRAFT_193906 [Calocera cornea HHB12733]|uniref:Uncharacterized protein n=1 Tax=Calocera cornea HHB12733 TaxID=1353952 RepID=A0A165C6M0_9BASI|nr:hypothetical protein CALCODRAFT_193906 [Calocera cornea HHB12733]